jgi:hypothetical protein
VCRRVGQSGDRLGENGRRRLSKKSNLEGEQWILVQEKVRE